MNYNTDNKTDTIYQPTIYQYANIIIDISHESVDKTFQYRIPEHLLGQITAGQQVYIPFGAGSHKRKGYVVELTNQAEYDISKIKKIDSLVEGSITAQSQLIHLAWWMKERYGSTMNQALKTVLPVKQKVREAPKRKIHLLVDALTLEAAIQTAERKKYKARLRLLYALKENPDLPYENTLHKLNLTAAAIRPLEQEGLLAVQVVNQYRNPLEEMRRLLTDDSKAQWKPPVLNKDQQRIAADQRRDRKRQDGSVHGTDQSCDPGWKAGHRPDPGDLPYLADSHAFLSSFRGPGICTKFPDVRRRAL